MGLRLLCPSLRPRLCKLYDPQVENGRPWVIGYQDPKQLLAINFAIGYPF